MLENLLNAVFNDFRQLTIKPVVFALAATFIVGFITGYFSGRRSAGSESRDTWKSNGAAPINPRGPQWGSHAYNRRLASIAAILTVVLILTVLIGTAILGGMVIPGWGGAG